MSSTFQSYKSRKCRATYDPSKIENNEGVSVKAEDSPQSRTFKDSLQLPHKASSKMNLIKAKLEKYLPNSFSTVSTQNTTTSVSKCNTCESESSTKWHYKSDGKLLCNTCYLCQQIYQKKTLLPATQDIEKIVTEEKTENISLTEDLESLCTPLTEDDKNEQLFCEYCGTNKTNIWWKYEGKRYCNKCQRKVVKENWNERSSNIHCRFCPAVFLCVRTLENHERHHLKPMDNEKYQCEQCTFQHSQATLGNHGLVHSENYLENWKKKYLRNIEDTTSHFQDEQYKKSSSGNTNMKATKIKKITNHTRTMPEDKTIFICDSDTSSSSCSDENEKVETSSSIHSANNIISLKTVDNVQIKRKSTPDIIRTDIENQEVVYEHGRTKQTANFGNDDSGLKIIVPVAGSDNLKRFRSRGVERTERICSNKNCRLTFSVVWRRDKEGNVLCNPCFLYLGRKQVHRPPELVKPITMSKRRKTGSLSHLTQVSLPFLSENELAAISAYDQNNTQENNVTMIEPIAVDNLFNNESLQQASFDSGTTSINSEHQSSHNTGCSDNSTEPVVPNKRSMTFKNSNKDITANSKMSDAQNKVTEISRSYNSDKDCDSDRDSIGIVDDGKLNEITDICGAYEKNTASDVSALGQNHGVTLINNVPVIHIVPEDYNSGGNV